MNTEYNSEQIEAFLRGELSKEEGAIIQQQMDEDPSFKQEVQLHQLAFDGINYVIEKDINAILANQEIERPALLAKKETSTKEQRLGWYLQPIVKRQLAYAATFLLLLWPTIEFIGPQINQENRIQQRLAAHRSINFNVAGENDDLLIKGQEAFNASDHTQAIAFFDQYLNQTAQENFEVMLYKSISLRQSGATEEAIKLLQYLESTSSQHYSGEEASWQLALSYVQEQQYDAARSQLNKIIDDTSNGKRKEARQLKKLIRFR